MQTATARLGQFSLNNTHTNTPCYIKFTRCYQFQWLQKYSENKQSCVIEYVSLMPIIQAFKSVVHED